jgi:predicted lipoprotein with Yx(FWY)xxD motif
MKKSATSILIIVVAIGAIVGTYFGLHKDKPSTAAHAHSTVAAKKTTYHATVSNSVFVTKASTALGEYLATPKGQALYTYTKDKKDVSDCDTNCVVNWPPYSSAGATATSLPSNIGTITRASDGIIQYTYKGLPLYTYVHDSSSKVSGNNVAGFKLARL